MDTKVAARIEALTHSSGWDDLKALLEEQEEKYWASHVKALKRGEPINQRELDRALGKLDGIRAILSAPVKAATILKRQDEEESK